MPHVVRGPVPFERNEGCGVYSFETYGKASGDGCFLTYFPGAEVFTAHTEQVYRVGDTEFEILSILDDTIHLSHMVNATAMVLKTQIAGQTILFMTEASVYPDARHAGGNQREGHVRRAVLRKTCSFLYGSEYRLPGGSVPHRPEFTEREKHSRKCSVRHAGYLQYPRRRYGKRKEFTMKKVIITCAINGGKPRAGENDHRPFTPKEIASEVVKCGKAGAAVCHIHAFDAEGKPSNDIAVWREIDRETRAAMKEAGVDMILDYATVGGTGAARYAHCLELRPEMATFPGGSLNWDGDTMFINSPPFLRNLGSAMMEAGIKPDIETFDGEMPKWAERFVAEGHLRKPLHFLLLLGMYGGADATVSNLLFLQRRLPAGSTYTVAGVGKDSLKMILSGLTMGADGVRCGMEDCREMDDGVPADNLMQIERIQGLLRTLNQEAATAEEAREILGIPVRGKEAEA